MKTLPLWIVAAFAWTIGAGGIFAGIHESRSFTILQPGSDANSHVSQVCWATERIVIASYRSRWVQAFDVETGKELWRKEFPKPISNLTCSTKHVFLVTHAGGGSIRRLELETGQDTTPKISPPKAADGTKINQIRIGSPRALRWNETLQVLYALQSELTVRSGEESLDIQNRLFLHSPDSLKAQPTLYYTGSLNPLASSNGATILLAERESQTCTLIDLSTGTSTLIYGPPLPKVAVDSFGGADDAPFLSNAFYSTDGSFIRIIDNFWSGGNIHFHPKPHLPSTKVRFPQGHIVAAVHWPSKRLLVSGMTTNLALCTTAGEMIEELKNVTGGRAYSLAFSPSGKKAASLSDTGYVKIFEID
ncbi:MAG: hypothetical protein QM627_10255 [Luteolibacter sp.]